MKDIMEAIFEKHYFSIHSLQNIQDVDAFFAVSEDQSKTNYYLVLFIDDLPDTPTPDKNFNSYYENIKATKEHHDAQTDKNLSMIICAKRNTLKTTEELNKKIFQIEEDPYFFKKYVLTYTEDQVKGVRKQTSVHQILDFMYVTLNDHESFLAFKSNPYEPSIYNLVARLFIKIPFLNLKNLDRKMNNLSQEINELITEEESLLRDQVLQNFELFEGKKELPREKLLEFIGVKENE